MSAEPPESRRASYFWLAFLPSGNREGLRIFTRMGLEPGVLNSGFYHMGGIRWTPWCPEEEGAKQGRALGLGFFFFFLVGFEDLKDWTEPNGKGS